MISPTDAPDTDESPACRFRRRRGWCLAAIQMAVLLLATVLLETFDADRRLASLFFRSGTGWYLAKAPIWVWLHDYGTIPGLVLTLAALSVWLVGLHVPRMKAWRKPCLLVVLTTVIGAGLLVNAVLKQYWGRPRPDQTTEFGGKWAYRPIYSPGTPGQGASFPCGHCTMGFVFLSMIGFRRQNKALAAGGVVVGIVLGVLLSAARIVQGAHFLSDTIWALGIVTMTLTVLDAYLAPPDGQDLRVVDGPVNRSRRIWITSAAVIGALLMAGGFLTRRPYYNTMVYTLPPISTVDTVRIRINADLERVSVRYDDLPEGRLQVDAHGFGWLRFDYRMGFNTQVVGHTLEISLDAKARSYFAELDHALTLTLPRNAGHPAEVMVNGRRVDSSRL
jgi:membrane-associated PAP2 superfamily phosphatase